MPRMPMKYIISLFLSLFFTNRYGVCTGWLQKLSKHLTDEHEGKEESLESNFGALSITNVAEVW